MTIFKGIAREPLTMEEIKTKSAEFADLYDDLENALSVAFAHYYGKYYRNMHDDVVRPEDGMQTQFRLVSTDEEGATFVVRGYTFIKEKVNPNPTPSEDPDHEPEDYFLTEETHTRERFVRMPFAFLENDAPFMEELAQKREKDAEKKREEDAAELVRLNKLSAEIDAEIEKVKARLV